MGVPFVGQLMRKAFGSRNERLVKRYQQIVNEVADLEEQVQSLTDQQLREKTAEFRERLSKGETSRQLMPEVFAVGREAMDRAVGIRNIFDPEQHFDPSVLPDSARQTYERIKQEIEQTEPREPEGDFKGNPGPVPAWQFVEIPNEIYDAVRDAYPKSKPPFRARPFDVQIIGAAVLYEGKIAEMKTGEGKTIVAPLAAYLAAVEDMQVHIVTVNAYLVQRDRDWTFPVYHALGLTAGAIHPYHMQAPEKKKQAYECDVVFGTTSEFGFDYLRDNMKLDAREQVQQRRDFAIVDEVDSTLIDEARTPLIISGLASKDKPRYELADKLARHLIAAQKDWNEADKKVQSCKVEISGLEGDIRNAADKSKIAGLREKLDAAQKRLPELEAERDKFTQYYEIEMDKRKAQLTHEGIAEAQKQAGVGSFYVGENMDLPHLMENALKAHTVYQRDRDYVVGPDDQGRESVIIVDQNTGRKMIGRQWSDGLHQAVEAKEGVAIKEETQTMATITIQNFFKLYKKIAGMTGTADTEATEFWEIYKLDVVCIPTNVQVNRIDHNDVVFMASKDKWSAVVDEIKAFHDIGQPVLVGTTSVETSEMISQMLTKKHSIKHEVLNAKHHEREAEIIAAAGQHGAVMIATNMAGRGTDIKLGSFTRQQLIDHWKRRNLCPKHVTAEMEDDEIIAAVYRHIAPRELDVDKSEIEQMDDDEVRLALLRRWAQTHCWIDESKAASMSEQALRQKLDAINTCPFARLRVFTDVEDAGGLHVVGTERHEARRIDNQLRGRSGRQGDKGSSRFFLSLEDDLMQRFAGQTTLKLLSKMGMKEGVALESPMLSRAIEKAQKKREEQNFLIRKNILEYDEPMDMQRGIFYGMRQDVVEGKRVKEIIFDQVESAVEDACYTYLTPEYAARCIAEWVREELNVNVDPERLAGKDREDMHKAIRVNAKEDASAEISLAIGEYMPDDLESGEWDVKSLADWANSNFNAGVTADELRDMSPTDVQRHLELAAERHIEAADLSGMDKYLVEHYGAEELAKWANSRFDTEFKAEDFSGIEEPHQAVDVVVRGAREAYAKRERTYPVDYAIEMTTALIRQDPQHALQQFCAWVRARYELDWDWQNLPSTDPSELRDMLYKEAEKWDDARVTQRAEKAVAAADGDVDALDLWFRENMNSRLNDEEREQAKSDMLQAAKDKIVGLMRIELTMFERQVLLQIFDVAWKDHLYTMDQLRESVNLRAVGQRDPRIEFKRESGRQFEEMLQRIRDRVTELVFKGRLSIPQPQQQQQQGGGDGSAPQRRSAEPAQPAISAAAAAASTSGTAAQQRDLEAAMQAGSGGSAGGSSGSSSGGSGGSGGSAAAPAKKKPQPVRAAPTVGRNEPCPCGSGKKYKQCCGKKS